MSTVSKLSKDIKPTNWSFIVDQLLTVLLYILLGFFIGGFVATYAVLEYEKTPAFEQALKETCKAMEVKNNE